MIDLKDTKQNTLDRVYALTDNKLLYSAEARQRIKRGGSVTLLVNSGFSVFIDV